MKRVSDLQLLFLQRYPKGLPDTIHLVCPPLTMGSPHQFYTLDEPSFYFIYYYFNLLKFTFLLLFPCLFVCFILVCIRRSLILYCVHFQAKK